MTRVSVVLNDMDRTEAALLSFRSWLLQSAHFDFRVVMNVFNDRRVDYERVASEVRQGSTAALIVEHPRPAAFNISAANNIGLHYCDGDWVFFANSDVVHTAAYLRRIMTELERRNLLYAIGGRVNLDQLQTRELLNCAAGDTAARLEQLAGTEFLPGQRIWGVGSPWMIRRPIVEEIGGFDPQIVCYEDRDLTERAMHYLRRTGKQDALWVSLDVFGYHLDHPPSDLYDIGGPSRYRLDARRAMLNADASSTADVMPCDLSDIKALERTLLQTPAAAPQILSRPRRAAVLNRLRKAARVLRHG